MSNKYLVKVSEEISPQQLALMARGYTNPVLATIGPAAGGSILGGLVGRPGIGALIGGALGAYGSLSTNAKLNRLAYHPDEVQQAIAEYAREKNAPTATRGAVIGGVAGGIVGQTVGMPLEGVAAGAAVGGAGGALTRASIARPDAITKEAGMKGKITKDVLKAGARKVLRDGALVGTTAAGTLAAQQGYKWHKNRDIREVQKLERELAIKQRKAELRSILRGPQQ